ncbi:hypothetical protein LZ30DRAFT_244404 [Colletotrichum cereale]|nr:hypothetical protein LZ30DRAFT_244404 [Colletotrichum cereale]
MRNPCASCSTRVERTTCTGGMDGSVMTDDKYQNNVSDLQRGQPAAGADPVRHAHLAHHPSHSGPTCPSTRLSTAGGHCWSERVSLLLIPNRSATTCGGCEMHIILPSRVNLATWAPCNTPLWCLCRAVCCVYAHPRVSVPRYFEVIWDDLDACHGSRHDGSGERPVQPSPALTPLRSKQERLDWHSCAYVDGRSNKKRVLTAASTLDDPSRMTQPMAATRGSIGASRLTAARRAWAQMSLLSYINKTQAAPLINGL